jgi:hypothetical protein
MHIHTCLLALILLTQACGLRPEKPEVRFAKAQRKLSNADLEELILWARSQLSTNTVRSTLPKDGRPAALAKLDLKQLSIVRDVQTGDEFVSMSLAFGLEIESIMIGRPDAKINNYGFTRTLTNGVYYIYRTN